MNLLENSAEMARLDAGRMLHFLHALPEAAEAAFERGQAARLPLAAPKQILICGMGGSAISGDLVRTQWLAEGPTPVAVHRGDRLPAYADAETLAIFMSYSGNTGETLGCLRTALERGVPAVVVSAGGEATAIAEAHGVPVVSVPSGWMPRAALGDLFFALLGVVSQLPGAPAADVAGTVARLRDLRARCAESVASAENPAKQLAQALFGHTPIVLGATPTTEAIALRWKCQFNENSKETVVCGALPEMTHNDIVNLTARSHDRHVVVALADPTDSAFVSRQRAITLDLLKPFVAGVHLIEGEGESLLSRQLTAIYLGDWVSVYWAFLNGVDPTPVDTIFALKDRMKVAMEGASR